jgi:hypothetical protein
VRSPASEQFRTPRVDMKLEKPHCCRFSFRMSFSRYECHPDVILDTKVRIREARHVAVAAASKLAVVCESDS